MKSLDKSLVHKKSRSRFNTVWMQDKQDACKYSCAHHLENVHSKSPPVPCWRRSCQEIVGKQGALSRDGSMRGTGGAVPAAMPSIIFLLFIKRALSSLLNKKASQADLEPPETTNSTWVTGIVLHGFSPMVPMSRRTSATGFEKGGW